MTKGYKVEIISHCGRETAIQQHFRHFHNKAEAQEFAESLVKRQIANREEMTHGKDLRKLEDYTISVYECK